LRADAFIDIKDHINIHLMGIGGAGMSGLALLLHSMGHSVSGCDAENTFYADKVRSEGVDISLGHHKAHLDLYAPDLIIHTSAIAQDHPELIEARRRGIRVARRAEILSLIFNNRRGVGVAGTHGKTTTSSMISLIAERAGMDPTVAIGGESSDIGCNAKLGNGEYMVAELDESDGSFEFFSPDVAVITNVDWDHIDHYPTYDSVIEAFDRYALGRKKMSSLVVCGEDKGVQRLLESGNHRDAVTYGWGIGWNWGATDVRHLSGGGVEFSVNHDGAPVGNISLKVSGEHNVLNALAAIAASDRMGVSFQSASDSLGTFRGAKRRLQFIGDVGNVLIYDDYGHHPREIAATMGAVGHTFPERPVHLVFQPHRYTRTEALYHDFASVLRQAAHIYLLPICSADEPPLPGVSSFLIADELFTMGRNDVVVCGDFQEASESLCDSVKPGDLVLTVGAGSIESLSKQILENLKRRVSVKNVETVGA
jgi:UDP-N-acetylmuramate--alanine ligase